MPIEHRTAVSGWFAGRHIIIQGDGVPAIDADGELL
jgi:hypothetical protein